MVDLFGVKRQRHHDEHDAASHQRQPTKSPSPPPPQPPSSLEHLFRQWRLNDSLRRYHARNLKITNLYPWQARCLAEPGVVEGTRDLLYFAPTSGGKTMVAELVLLLRVAGPRMPLVRDSQMAPGGAWGAARSGVAPKGPEARRAIVVLPFISMVNEKVKHLQRVVAPYNKGRPRKDRIKVKAMYGGKGGGGVGNTNIAVCTIEKATSLVNRMLAAGELHELTCLVVDELHMIGDGGRGQTLELLLTKVLRANRIAAAAATASTAAIAAAASPPPSKPSAELQSVPVLGTVPEPVSGMTLNPPSPDEADEVSTQGTQEISDGHDQEPVARPWRVQVIGMSATLSNSDELAEWLDASLHISDYRPVPLDERILLGIKVYDKTGQIVRTFQERADPETDPDHVVTLCRESVRAGDQVIIFCSTKAFCHNCAAIVARNLKVPASKGVETKRSALVAQLAKMPMGVDPTLQETIPCGVAVHHASLADTERSGVEKGFREGTLSVLAATSTLGAGVNLPAGRVILRNLNVAGGGLSATSYRQMAGRAGRKGEGRARGEAVVVAANEGQKARASALMNAGLAAVKSALAPASDGGAGMTRLVLEAICAQLVTSADELAEYLRCTLLWCQQPDDAARESLLDHAWAALYLLENEDCIEVESPPRQSSPQATTTPPPPQSTHPPPPPPPTAAVAAAAMPPSKPTAPAAPLTSARPTVGRAATAGSTNAVRNPYGNMNALTAACKKGVAVAAVGVAPKTVSVGGTAGISSEKRRRVTTPYGTSRGVGVLGASGAVYGRGGATGATRRRTEARRSPRSLDLNGAVRNGRFSSTKLGLAIFRSSMAPGEGLEVFRDLSDASGGINLNTTLYLAYLLTPPRLPPGLRPNWEWLRSVHSKAAASAEANPTGSGADVVDVFHRVGITEGHLHAWVSTGQREGNGVRDATMLARDAVERAAAVRRGVSVESSGGGGGGGGGGEAAAVELAGESAKRKREEASKPRFSPARNAVRLVAAMALTDVSGGSNLGQVAKFYGMSKGDLQSLRQSAATFSAMVSSFLKELGWQSLLMLIKGHIPRLSLGVSNHLLPLMQVPGMSRAEANALYQGSVLNAKSLLSASLDVVATALRVNVPFRTSAGDGKERGEAECIRFERRAHMLRQSAREVIAKREKVTQAQQAKLLRVLRGQCGKDVGGLIGGCGNQEIVKVVSKTGKRKRGSGGGGSGDGINQPEVTGLQNGSSDDSSGSSSAHSDNSDGDDSETEQDDLDKAVAALMSGRQLQSEESDEDSDNNGDDNHVGSPFPGQRQKLNVVEGQNERTASVPLSGPPVLRLSPPHSPSTVSSIRDSAAGRVDAGGERKPAKKMDAGTKVAGKIMALKSTPRVATEAAAAAARAGAAGAKKTVIKGNVTPIGDVANVDIGRHKGVRPIEKSTAYTISREVTECAGVPRGSRGGVKKHALSPAAPAKQQVFMTPSNAPGSASNIGTCALPCRTPIKSPPAAGSQCFLYEAETPPPDILSLESLPSSGGALGSDDDRDYSASTTTTTGDSENIGGIGPAYDACRRRKRTDSSGGSGGDAGRGVEKDIDVFARGEEAMADFSEVWRRSKCFSFVLVGREGPRLFLAPGGGVAGDDGWTDHRYRRSWNGLSSPVLPVAPYTVESASFVAIEKQHAVQVVSAIAVSFDGKTSHLLRLPMLLPPRPLEWGVLRTPCDSNYTEDGNGNAGISGDEGVGGGGETFAAGVAGLTPVTIDGGCGNNERGPPDGENRTDHVPPWESLPARAVEAVVVFIGFPWLRAGLRKESGRHGNGSRGTRSRFKSGDRNRVMSSCRRWNVLGVAALNRCTAEEPSGRWGLLRDVMENPKSAKVCMNMKAALVCLRALGVRVKGTLEDPAVANWLVEPPVDDDAAAALAAPPETKNRKKKKAKTPLPPPPRAQVTNLSLERQPRDFMDLWCLQAAATLSLMADTESKLHDLSLTLPFHLIEMPAVVAAAEMEYCGLAVRGGRLQDMRREVNQRLADLSGLAEQVVAGNTEDSEGARQDTNILASRVRLHDTVYTSLKVAPPPSWKQQLGRNSAGGDTTCGRYSKRAQLGPTDTASLQEILAVAGPSGLARDAKGFIRSVIEHRTLSPASRSLSRLINAKRWHAHLEGYRVNPRVELLTSTGRMVTSDPPLQNLDHKIRLTRSLRPSLAQEMDADVPEVKMIPRLSADDPRSGGKVEDQAGGRWEVLPSQGSSEEEQRQGLKVTVGSSDASKGMGIGYIVAIIQNRSLNDPIFMLSLPSINADGCVTEAGSPAAPAAAPAAPAPAEGESMASLWRERGFSITDEDAKRTCQVRIRLGSSTSGKVYSYPASMVFRVQASFIAHPEATSLCGEDTESHNPWFGKEVCFKPRDSVVASPGYTFVSADYSQIEMRLMAHLSGDPDLARVFKDGGDVFRRISAALDGGGKKPEDVSDDERRQAKIIVYGVLYGQSSGALAQQLGNSRAAADRTHGTVLRTYPKLRNYIERVKRDCKQHGYVETLLGRRRYLTQINSNDNKERARAERQAVNTVCQGSAADLLKLAATNIAARLERCRWMSKPGNTPSVSSSADNTSAATSPLAAQASRSCCRFPDDRGRTELARCPPCRLVLSIHDELVYEVLESRAAEVAQIVRSCMEGAVSLTVPLVAQPRHGSTWGSMTLFD